ncbi:hypothetical protein A7U60_g5872 [Sanghuangporus baumii]|uniref:Uncharacterized protein n=1 Tax=Sanghuangporus baumii TaxID=108892 RepID=A0A9Q5N327_SANBA|nr:hypothetical protein A7U60_g5872 [Sanghuangporus baumii]
MSSTTQTVLNSQNPPPYSPPLSLAAAESNFGFPSGYFVIRSLATGRVLDVEHDSLDDGAEIILWPEKESLLVDGLRKPEADNQVFFVDMSGALCSRLSGHAVDIEDGKLVQRHRRPVSYPYPNAFSHPLPQFWYSATSKQIFVRHQCDPSFPDPSVSSNAWRQRSYILSSVPMRKPRSFLENASDALNSVFTNPLTSIFGATSQATVREVHDSDIDLREHEVLEEDRGEGEEADDSPEPLRKVAVVALPDQEEILTLATFTLDDAGAHLKSPKLVILYDTYRTR